MLKIVILDFQDVNSIGRAFADEIFRVFARNHPDILLIPINIVKSVKKIIEFTKSKEKKF